MGTRGIMGTGTATRTGMGTSVVMGNEMVTGARVATGSKVMLGNKAATRTVFDDGARTKVDNGDLGVTGDQSGHHNQDEG